MLLGGLSQAAGPSSGQEQTGEWEGLADPQFSSSFVEISSCMKAPWNGPCQHTNASRPRFGVLTAPTFYWPKAKAGPAPRGGD